MEIKIFSGSSNPSLAQKISDNIKVPLGIVELKKFKNDETSVKTEEVRGKDVYIIQSGCTSGNNHLNDNLMELLLMVSACQRSSATRVTAVIPCFPYARQDRQITDEKSGLISPISAKLVADLIKSCGATEVITMDVHAPQVQGFFDIPVTNLLASSAVERWIEKYISNWKECVIVSPDAGGTKRVTHLATKLKVNFAIIHKERKKAQEVASMVLIGDVTGKTVIIIDDIADTCKTILHAVEELQKKGAKDIYAIVTHGILSDSAIEDVHRSHLKALVVTNTIPQAEYLSRSHKIKVIDVSGIFADAIIKSNGSV